MKTFIKLILVLWLSAVFSFAQNSEEIFNRGLENIKAKKYAACVSDFKAYIAYEPEVPQAHFNLGLCYTELENHADAVTAYREAVRLKPDYYAALVQLGNELDVTGSYTQAVLAYNKAIKIDPNNYSAHLELGVAHNNAGKYLQALTSYRTALLRDPDNTSAIYGIGLVQYNLKNKAEVKKQLDYLILLGDDKADLLQTKYDSLQTVVKPPVQVVKKPAVKTAQRIKDERDVAAMNDLGFDGAFVTVVSSIRETAARTGKVLLAVKRNDILSLVARAEENGFYKVVDEKSGVEGYIAGSVVVVKLTGNTENTGPQLSDDGAGESVLANPVVSISNGETKTTLKIRLNGTLYLIPPQTTKDISVTAGKFTYYGWSPGIRLTSGKSTLEKGRRYSWSFKIYRR
jgi:tetratricopeptide (TPR) repeat protein